MTEMRQKTITIKTGRKVKKSVKRNEKKEELRKIRKNMDKK